MEPKTEKNYLKSDAPKKHAFEHDFPKYLIDFASQNEAKIKCFKNIF